MKRILYVLLTLVAILPPAVSGFCAEIDLPVIVTDIDGNECAGILLAGDSEKIVLRVDGETTEYAWEHIRQVINLLDDPFQDQGKAGRRARLRSTRGGEVVSSLLEQRRRSTGEDASLLLLPGSVIVFDLLDGSRLVVREAVTKDGIFKCRTREGNEFDLSMLRVRAARLAVTSHEDILAPPSAWLKFFSSDESRGDRLVVGSSNALDSYVGIVGEMTRETVTFAIDGENLPVPRRKVYGILFYRDREAEKNRTPVAPVRGTLLLRDGSLAMFANLQVSDDGLKWTTTSGVAGRSDWKDIEHLSLGGGNTVLVSSLVPLQVRQELLFDGEPAKPHDDASNLSPIQLYRLFRTERLKSLSSKTSDTASEIEALWNRPSMEGRPGSDLPDRPLPGPDGVRLDGISYPNGLALSTGMSLEYILTEPFVSLRGVAGIDDRMRPEGQARLRILADDRILCDRTLYGVEPPEAIRYDLPPNTGKLTIRVDFLDGSPLPGILGLGDLKLVR